MVIRKMIFILLSNQKVLVEIRKKIFNEDLLELIVKQERTKSIQVELPVES